MIDARKEPGEARRLPERPPPSIGLGLEPFTDALLIIDWRLRCLWCWIKHYFKLRNTLLKYLKLRLQVVQLRAQVRYVEWRLAGHDDCSLRVPTPDVSGAKRPDDGGVGP